MTDVHDVLDAHLNVSWLRPENAIWDSAATIAVREHEFARPMLDLGSGNGIFSFLTTGGRFTHDFDWFLSTEVDRPRGGDIYDAPAKHFPDGSVARAPEFRIDVALDHKQNLLSQAGELGLYDKLVCHDGTKPLPFKDGEFASIFSNILYWLHNPADVVRECSRVLQPGGRAVFCMPDPTFYEFAVSYKWKEKNSELWKLVNAGRSANIQWAITFDKFEEMAKASGFRITGHKGYLSRLTLTVWDIGLRLLSRPLIRMANSQSPEQRRAIKEEWMESSRPVLRLLLEEELKNKGPHGYHCFALVRQ